MLKKNREWAVVAAKMNAFWDVVDVPMVAKVALEHAMMDVNQHVLVDAVVNVKVIAKMTVSEIAIRHVKVVAKIRVVVVVLTLVQEVQNNRGYRKPYRVGDNL